MKSMTALTVGSKWGGKRRLSWVAPFTAAFLFGCSQGPEGSTGPDFASNDELEAPAVTPTDDGLADAYDEFLNIFVPNGFESQFPIGYAFHLGLSTEQVKGTDGQLVSGQARLDLNRGQVTATINHAPKAGDFDLWLVKNVAGGTVAPEKTDQMLKVGRFSSKGETRTLDVNIGFDIAFDLDLVVVTRAGKKPTESRIAVGDRTLFEKRLFRFRQGKGLDPVSGTLANNIETQDPLVARGAQLFFNETFGGNGRTCGTCHRADDNLTIDPAFIATLPQSDPLFVAENNPKLAKLENPTLLRTRGLILENLDGFDDPTNVFVMRGVPHTLSLNLTNGISRAFGGPPDQALGWGGDGGPGRSTLHEFTFGAIMQHFTKTLARKPGTDFRIPTEEELDALEAFQLFNGKQKPRDFFSIFPTDPSALRGQGQFGGIGCTFCHNDLFGSTDSFNSNFDTGVANVTPDLPHDDGFNGFGPTGDGTFNVPPLAEAADTGPFFHNNAFNTIEDAVGFYFSDTFRNSPSSFFIFGDLSTEEQRDIASFLRVVNSATNIEQVRRRVDYVKNVRSTGNTELLKIAIADTKDARKVLFERGLNPEARTKIKSAEELLNSAKNAADNKRPDIMRKVLKLLDHAVNELFTSTPPDTGEGGAGNVGGFGGKGGTSGTGGSLGGEAGADTGAGGSVAGTAGVGAAPGAGGTTVGKGGGSSTGGTTSSSGGTSTGSGGGGGASGTSGGGGRGGRGG